MYETNSIWRISVEREDSPLGNTALNTYDVCKKNGKADSYPSNQHFVLDLSGIHGQVEI